MPAFTATTAPCAEESNITETNDVSFAAHNVLFQWISILMPSTLGVEALNSVELAAGLL